MKIKGMLSVFVVTTGIATSAAMARDENPMYRFGDVVGRYKAFAAACGGPSADVIEAEAIQQAHNLYSSHSKVSTQFRKDIERGYRTGKRKLAATGAEEACDRFWPSARATYNRAMGRRQDATPAHVTPTNDIRPLK